MQLKLNPIVLDIIEENNEHPSAINYYLSLYFGYKDIFTPVKVQGHLRRIGVCTVKNNVVTWHFEPISIKEDPWSWVVNDYRKRFKDLNPERAGSPSECKARMIDFFKGNPEVRKDEILGATEMYLSQVKNPEYLKTSHFFIWKQEVGRGQVSLLQSWLDIYRENSAKSVNPKSIMR